MSAGKFVWKVELYGTGLGESCEEITHRIVDCPYADSGFIRAELADGGYVAYKQEAVRRWLMTPEAE